MNIEETKQFRALCADTVKTLTDAISAMRQTQSTLFEALQALKDGVPGPIAEDLGCDAVEELTECFELAFQDFDAAQENLCDAVKEAVRADAFAKAQMPKEVQNG